MSAVRIAINGAAGRMGQRLVALAHADPGLELVAAIDGAQHPAQGADAGTLAGVGEIGCAIGCVLPEGVDVAVDFSTPPGTMAIVEACLATGTALVVATTGLSADEEARTNDACEKIALLSAPNMSLAVNLLMKLAAVAAEALRGHPAGIDVEIIERHHRYKEDAPSGTALRFGEIISRIMNLTSETHGRQGRPGARPQGEIGYHAVRSGDNPGEHAILFGMPGEIIELAVRATSRDGYAQGALVAAKYLAGKAPGRYSIDDVLGL